MTIHNMLQNRDSYLGSTIKQVLKEFKTSKGNSNFPEIEMLANTLMSDNGTTYGLSNNVYYHIMQGKNNNGIFRDSSVKTLYVKRDTKKSPRTFKSDK